jgi:hypothetical protein
MTPIKAHQYLSDTSSPRDRTSALRSLRSSVADLGASPAAKDTKQTKPSRGLSNPLRASEPLAALRRGALSKSLGRTSGVLEATTVAVVGRHTYDAQPGRRTSEVLSNVDYASAKVMARRATYGDAPRVGSAIPSAAGSRYAL